MMKAYFNAREALAPGTLLFLRLGDYYELFFEDAVIGARILNITLTKRGEMPMAGVPYHAIETYANKLAAAGKDLAILEIEGRSKNGEVKSILRIRSRLQLSTE